MTSENSILQEENTTPSMASSLRSNSQPQPSVTRRSVHFQDPPHAPQAQDPPHAPQAPPNAPIRSTGEMKRIADFNNAGNVEAVTTRAKRTRKPRQSLNYDTLGGIAQLPAYSASADQQIPAIVACFSELPPHVYHQAFSAKKNKDPDTLSFDEAMADTENIEAWRKAAAKEINQLEEKHCWEECQKSEAKGESIIPSTWVFRRKRNPAGDITKYKARICLRGDLMDSNEESFAPVCSWSSVRLFLVIAMILKWNTISVDYNNAFIQAILKKPMFMSIPRGFKSKLGAIERPK